MSLNFRASSSSSQSHFYDISVGSVLTEKSINQERVKKNDGIYLIKIIWARQVKTEDEKREERVGRKDAKSRAEPRQARIDPKIKKTKGDGKTRGDQGIDC